MGISARTAPPKGLAPAMEIPIETEAAVLVQLNSPLEIRKLKIPELKAGQVLVKIAYSGICHSQLNEISGKKGEDKFLPHCLGHEGSGIVLKTGDDVKKVKEGDAVVLSWIKSKGANAAAAQYNSASGIVNSGAISTFMPYAVISENRLVPIPPQIPLEQAALLGCAIPTGAGIILNTAKVGKGSTVAIFGLGGIGLSALLGAKLISDVKVIAVDISEDKLSRAKALGAEHLINSTRENPVRAIKKLTQDQGVDYALEAAGKKESMEAAFQSIKVGSGLCVIAGNLAQGEKIAIDPFDLILGKRILGTWGGETNPDLDIPRYVNESLSGHLPLDRLITHRYTLQQINRALEDLQNGNVGRALLEL